MTDLADRRDRGRLDDGQYTDLAKDLERERVENLLDLQRLLEGRSPAIDDVLRLALTESDEITLVQKLAEPARSKQLPQSRLDLIQRGEGSLVQWIIELSFARADRTAAA